MANPLLSYSTNTTLAYGIAKQYFADLHWVWCSPFFRSPILPRGQALPPSAVPAEIYNRLFEDVANGDRHSSWISQNRVGLLRGAQEKLAAGSISADDHEEIVAIVDAAEIKDFAPLLYIAPYEKVASLKVKVPPAKRAHPMSQEFIIESLPGTLFDVITFS